MKSHGGETMDVLLTYLPNRSTGFNVGVPPKNGERIRLDCGRF